MRRTRPLEPIQVDLGSGRHVVAPTPEEALRIKAYLVVQRNAVRDYLDVVALADHLDTDAVPVLAAIDEFYLDRSEEAGSVLTQLVLRLARPRPRDPDVSEELPRYKGLASRWHDWSVVVGACEDRALHLSGAVE